MESPESGMVGIIQLKHPHRRHVALYCLFKSGGV
jgi:hypothetical protein